MSNYKNATAVVPTGMPAAMAGLTGNFASVRAVLAGLGLDLATGGTFVDTVMGCDHPSMMGDRHDRIVMIVLPPTCVGAMSCRSRLTI